MLDFIKSLVPDIGEAGFFKGFVRYLQLILLTFLISGFESIVPVIKTFAATYDINPIITVILGNVIGGIVWVVTWLKTRTPKNVVPVAGEIV